MVMIRRRAAAPLHQPVISLGGGLRVCQGFQCAALLGAVPGVPRPFGSIEDARAFSAAFLHYYSHVHSYAGVGLHAPASAPLRHRRGHPEERAATLDAVATPNRPRSATDLRHHRTSPPSPESTSRHGSTHHQSA